MRFTRKSPLRHIVPVLFLGFVVSGCGTGGNGKTVALPALATPTPTITQTLAPTATPTATATPLPIVNTSLQSYLPFHAGNTWIFGDGSRIVDAGSIPLQCTCAFVGLPVEVMDFFGPSYTFLSAELFNKGSGPTAGHRFTYLIGTSSAANGAPTNLAVPYPGASPGIIVMDDLPMLETISYPGVANAAQTTIAGVGGVIHPANSQVQNVAEVQISGFYLVQSAQLFVQEGQHDYTFALGVGFAALPVSTGDIAWPLASFSVSLLSTV